MDISSKSFIIVSCLSFQLEERGPYVYTTTSRKIEVKFDASGKVTYKTFQQQKFNEEMTSKLCPKCHENDKVRKDV